MMTSNRIRSIGWLNCEDGSIKLTPCIDSSAMATPLIISKEIFEMIRDDESQMINTAVDMLNKGLDRVNHLSELKNCYVLRLVIQSGGYEHRTHRLIYATSKEQAIDVGLVAECFGELGHNAEWTNNGISDLGDEFHYSVEDCKLVQTEHIKTVEQYLN